MNLHPGKFGPKQLQNLSTIIFNYSCILSKSSTYIHNKSTHKERAVQTINQTHNLIDHPIDHGSKVLDHLDVLGVQVRRLGKALDQFLIGKVDAAYILVFLLGHDCRIDDAGRREGGRDALGE